MANTGQCYLRVAKTLVGCLEFNVPFQHKYGISETKSDIRSEDDVGGLDRVSQTRCRKNAPLTLCVRMVPLYYLPVNSQNSDRFS